MLSTARQSANHAWPIFTGPIVVLAQHKNSLNVPLNAVSNAAKYVKKFTHTKMYWQQGWATYFPYA